MRQMMRRWLDEAVRAVDPDELTAAALMRRPPRANTVIALGKAAPGMCRGADRALGGGLRGLCVAAGPAHVPEGIELLIGDHPVPGERSFEAGRRVVETARGTTSGCLVLVSGGGSALCEAPRPGVEREYLRRVNQRLLTSGASIEEANFVRGHLSAIKRGGLSRSGAGPFHTYVLSDVAGAGPEVVASGPTLPMRHDPGNAMKILVDIGMEVPKDVWDAMSANEPMRSVEETVTVIGDGRTAAAAITDAALAEGVEARVMPGWLVGETRGAVDSFLGGAGRGVTVACGETSIAVTGDGRGGRNTHAALLAAKVLEGTNAVFAAFATDGVDGSAGAAGAIVDGDTLARGGDPAASIERFDSATYLAGTGDLIETGPTGTNVADLWLLWRP